VFEAMKKDNVTPNTITYNALISASQGQLEKAWKVFEAIK
jgi:hypothetical protein